MADMAAARKTEKYSTLSSAYRFEPIAVESVYGAVIMTKVIATFLAESQN